MEKLETIFLTIVLNDILERVNKTSKILQSKDVDIFVAIELLKSLKAYLREMRDKFSEYEAKVKAGVQIRNMAMETNVQESEVCVLPDMMGQQNRDQLKTIACNELSQRCEKLANAYHEDFEYNELLNECKQFKHYIVHDEECKTLPDMYSILIPDKLKSVFPNVEIALRIFMCMMVTTCSGERSFSRLKLTKNHLRSTMGQQWLNLLSLMCTESDILKNIDFQPIIKQISAMKCRKSSS
ncbi:uncharacterized protein LOC111087236 [Limulus polyphemus]|uniref:Uncharacterized protein LOC111087236 n=1 Tax=Limulus polyphemus TaxID=6850 RepID=A0ABM1SZ47_LIMPO|nr:uncharacterized protein LOC111087236 [Limulus polyphemus]